MCAYALKKLEVWTWWSRGGASKDKAARSQRARCRVCCATDPAGKLIWLSQSYGNKMERSRISENRRR